jgi:hypothetical protein
MWIPDANVSRLQTDILTVINYYRMLATGMDVVLFPPIKLMDGESEARLVYPNVGVIIRRRGPRNTCLKDRETQIYEGPPNFVLEMESKHGYTDMQKKRDLYETNGVQEALFLEQNKPAIWYQLRKGKFEILGQEPSGTISSKALPSFVMDFEKFKSRKWLKMMVDLKNNVNETEVAKQFKTEYGL